MLPFPRIWEGVSHSIFLLPMRAIATPCVFTRSIILLRRIWTNHRPVDTHSPLRLVGHRPACRLRRRMGLYRELLLRSEHRPGRVHEGGQYGVEVYLVSRASILFAGACCHRERWANMIFTATSCEYHSWFWMAGMLSLHEDHAHSYPQRLDYLSHVRRALHHLRPAGVEQVPDCEGTG